MNGESKGLFREIIIGYYISKQDRPELREQKCDLFDVRTGSTCSFLCFADRASWYNS